MPRSSFKAAWLMMAQFSVEAQARPRPPAEDYAASHAALPASGTTGGAIFRADDGYAPLTSGAQAARVGDVLTVVLAERMATSTTSRAATSRGGEIGLNPPTAGPFALFAPSDVNMGGAQSFTGKGEAAQSHLLTGEVSVTIAAIYPNGTMLVRGEKRLTLNRGDETVQISGRVRAADISLDNRVLSHRIADARIRYTGKGEIARASRQGWLQRFFSVISPF